MTVPGSRSNLQRQPSSIGISVLLFGVVVGTFFAATRNGFIDFDDTLFVTANAQVQGGLTWDNVTWALRNPVAANWHPLTVLSHMADCECYGLKPWGHHLTSVLLHAATTVLVFLVFRRMTGAPWRCAVLAALFALHPLRVESVAWVTERKDVLSTLFWMLALWAYGRYVENAECRLQNAERGREKPEGGAEKSEGSPKSAIRSRELNPAGYYGLALVFFALGLMSKPMVVTLPFVLLLLDYWPLKRLELNTQHSKLKTLLPLVREKLPFFALSAFASGITFLVQRQADAVAINLSLAARGANALVSYVRYLGKMFWPENLSVFYPHPQQWLAWQVITAAGLLLAMFVTVIVLMRRRPYLGVGWLWFCGTLVPVIGLVQVGSQSMADRYSYVPSIGLCIMVVWGVHQLFTRWRYQRVALAVAALAAVLVCVALTRRQTGYWKDGESLWKHALAVTQNNDIAQHNLACALADKELFDEAIRRYEEALRMNPGRADTHSGLAYALTRKQRFAEAIQEYEETLHRNPNDAEAHNNLGSLLLKQGRVEEAIQHYHEALRLNPADPEPHANLALALITRGHYREAAAQLREVLRLNPNDINARQRLDGVLAAQEKSDRATEPYRNALKANPGDARAHSELGRVLLEAGQVDEAIEKCAEAVRLAPRSAAAQYQLGAALARKGEGEKAAHQFELAVELDPNFAAGHYALGIVCQQQDRMPEALKHWREAARLAPQWADPLNNLAWALATASQAERRDGLEAVKLAARAVELAGTNHVGVLDTLAAAYAEAGRFAEASSTARQAEAEAEAQGQAELAEQIRQRLTLYGSRQPYRQGPLTK